MKSFEFETRSLDEAKEILKELFTGMYYDIKKGVLNSFVINSN